MATCDADPSVPGDSTVSQVFGRASSRRMPCLTLSTNVSLDGVDTSAILSAATKSVASIIGKPESYVMIVLKGSVPMSFGGKEDPAAYGELVSIGGLNPDVNKKLSAAVASILETQLSVPKSRFFIKFYDTKSLTWVPEGEGEVLPLKRSRPR